jgi:plastocyanin
MASAGTVALLAAGCGGTESASAPPTPKKTVVIKDDAYQPATVRIPVGGRVTWVSRLLAPVTVETDGVGFFEHDREKLDRENKFDLHTFAYGEAESEIFDTPGRYDYHSSFDQSLRGTVVVTRPTDASTPRP